MSVAVTCTLTVGSASWLSETPSFSLSWPSTTSKRLSETWKLCLSPASGSATVSVPTTAPAAFSRTWLWSSDSAVCASLTSPTEREKVSCTLLPALSVATTVTLRFGSLSKSSETPSFSFSWPFTTSKRLSDTSKLWVSPASGSMADSAPITAPATFSTTALPERLISVGVSFTSPTVMAKVCWI